MKVKPSLFLLIASCLASAPAFAAGHLTATLTPTDAGNSSVINLIVENDGDQAVSVYDLTIPTKLSGGMHLPGKRFVVTEVSANGEKDVAYKGNWVHPIRLSESQFITIDPGKSISLTYDLSSDYAVEVGKVYHVFYSSDIDAAPTDMAGNLLATKLHLPTQKNLTSNVLNITPKETTVSARTTSAASYPPVTDSGHLAILKSAWLTAYSYYASVIANDYTNGEPPLYFQTSTYSVGGGDYNWWFAPYNNGDSNDKLIAGTIFAIANRMMGQYNTGTPTHPVAYQEGDDDCSNSDTAAVAQTGSIASSGTYLIAVCPLFYQLTESPVATASASQVSTLIHEISHFSDLATDVRTSSEGYYGNGQPWMHPTVDVSIGSYTLSGAHNLALTNRSSAVTNASNYEFYEANTPAH